MKIILGEERVVLQGPAYEDTIWGVMQFPTVYKTDDNKIIVRIHVGDDVWTDLGDENKVAWCISEDGGETFARCKAMNELIGTKLSNGDRIYFPPQTAIVYPVDKLKIRRGFTARIPSDKIEKQADGSFPYPTFAFRDASGSEEHLLYDFDTLPDEYAKKQ